MALSIQTNVTSMQAQENLRLNGDFQGRTIQRLTSGYRINSSGDDAAGLAIANGLRSDVAELTQGVRNANDGLSQLQIIDGGLNNISKSLDRLKTLATQAASTTFTGERKTLNLEYQQLLGEVTRQASNVGLNDGGRFNAKLGVYIGGGNNQANSEINVDLSGKSSAVDAKSLGLSTTNVLDGGVGLSGTQPRLDANGASFLTGSTTQDFTFNAYNGTNAVTKTVTVTGDADGLSSDEVLNQLNTGLADIGLTASLDEGGKLQFSGATAFTANVTGSGTDPIAGTGTIATNTSNYSSTGTAFTTTTAARTLTFQTAGGSRTVSLATGTTLDAAISQINTVTSQDGVYAVKNDAGTGISLQGSSSFSFQGSNAELGLGTTLTASTAPVAGTANNAKSAITAIDNAVKNLGLVQGKIGAGQNKLQNAIQLAQSQIANVSAAESRIRDADVAQEAANLTKAQVLSQASIAAMSQANSAPQAVLSLLRG